VFILTDEKSIDQIVSVLKNNIQNNKDLISNLSNIALILYVSSKIYIDIQKLSISIWAKPTIAYPSTHNKSEFQ
jgi:hypothetical protein